MVLHFTKTKGDAGVACVIADLAKQGIGVAIPLSEHMPFDLIAMLDGKLSRVQVKYCSLQKNGALRVPLINNYSTSKGLHSKRADMDKIDAYAIYCPNTDLVYYVASKSILTQATNFCLRVTGAKNRQIDGVRFAETHRNAIAALFY